MAVSPYTSQSISGYNASPPPDDGTQTSANKVTWAKHKDKIGDPIKTLAEGINTQAVSAINTLSLTDWTTITTSATIAESDWHNGVLALATVGINFPAPAGLENGWHNWIYNGSAGDIDIKATATDTIRMEGLTASQVSIGPGGSAMVMNTATTWVVLRARTPVDVDMSIAAQMFRS